MSGPCFRHVSLRTHPMPSRTIEESHRPRVSDRTMHCHSSSGQSSGLLFRKTMGAVTTAKWNHRNEELILRFAHGDEPRPQDLRKTTLGVDVQTVGLNAEKKRAASSRRAGVFS
jgi:hypothetical protein